MKQFLLVLDFGGQYKELIARAVRECGVYSEIRHGGISIEEIKSLNPAGIILTGGPNSVYANDAPVCDLALFELGIPVLGICYGMQLMCHLHGGKVAPSLVAEYGQITVNPTGEKSKLITSKTPFEALMSHRDSVLKLPAGFEIIATTKNCIAVCENKDKKLYGVQFHPETKHTQGGKRIIKNFVQDICGCAPSYRLRDYIKTQTKKIKAQVGDKRILLGLSGGVDSSVCAALLSRAVPNQLTCVFVDHGFMRQGEGDEIEEIFSSHNLNFIRVNVQDRFLKRLEGIDEPEQKRKIIGEEFVRVFEEEAKKIKADFLAQGTIYPDVVESGGAHGAVIKSHHNVGGLPEQLLFEGVVEPLDRLFKDEVRKLGKKLGLPKYLIERQPFPGPGLAIRIMGTITKDKLETLRQADAIVRQELDGKGSPSQYFAVLTNVKSVGVKGDSRTYENVVAVRAVTTDDFMTCKYTRLSHNKLDKISTRITSEIALVSRVVFDITNKPPATVEWE